MLAFELQPQEMGVSLCLLEGWGPGLALLRFRREA